MNKSRFLWLKPWLSIFVDPNKILALQYLPKYVKAWKAYNRLDDSRPLRIKDSYPCLSDQQTTTPFDAHYFYQAAWLSRRLAATNPESHVDIGSSIGMISTISAFVPTYFLDFRPLNARMENLTCIAGDGLFLPFADNKLKSISSLHVIEHIGLGRYGDPLNIHGSEMSAKELIRVLSPGGRLYVSVPVGRKRTQFNAHRIFNPYTVNEMFSDLKIVNFGLIDDNGQYNPSADPLTGTACDYGCGLFEMTK